MKEKIVDFYLNEDILKLNYEKFSKIGQVYYPLKVNSNETILRELIKLYDGSNNGFLVTHISHYDKLIRLGVTPDKMCLVNVIADNDIVKYLYDKGVRYFTFDDVDYLKYFLSYANPNEVKISINTACLVLID